MMEAGERELLSRSVQRALEDHDGPALDGALISLGWADGLADEGIRPTAIAVLFEAQGRAGRSSTALDQVVINALGYDPTQVGVVYPSLGGWDPPAQPTGPGVIVRGVASRSLNQRETVLVVAGDGSAGLVAASLLELRPVAGVDPWLGLIEVGGVVPSAAAGLNSLDNSLDNSLNNGQWTTAVMLAQLAIGHELVGASRQMLELARTHALNRVQFDRPIGAFQAVRHRLADALVAIETADAALDAAWLDGSPQAAATAKALAGRGAATASRHCQQVLAGIGFTTEHPLHRFVRRVLVLDQLFGSSRALTRRLGEELLASRRLPSLTPL